MALAREVSTGNTTLGGTFGKSSSQKRHPSWNRNSVADKKAWTHCTILPHPRPQNIFGKTGHSVDNANFFPQNLISSGAALYSYVWSMQRCITPLSVEKASHSSSFVWCISLSVWTELKSSELSKSVEYYWWGVSVEPTHVYLTRNILLFHQEWLGCFWSPFKLCGWQVFPSEIPPRFSKTPRGPCLLYLHWSQKRPIWSLGDVSVSPLMISRCQRIVKATIENLAPIQTIPTFNWVIWMDVTLLLFLPTVPPQKKHHRYLLVMEVLKRTKMMWSVNLVLPPRQQRYSLT